MSRSVKSGLVNKVRVFRDKRQVFVQSLHPNGYEKSLYQAESWNDASIVVKSYRKAPRH